MSRDDEKQVRSSGGKLALWSFWLFCLYFLWNLVLCIWSVSRAEVSPVNLLQNAVTAASGQSLVALLRLLAFSAVGLMLGSIAWYTRPRER